MYTRAFFGSNQINHDTLRWPLLSSPLTLAFHRQTVKTRVLIKKVKRPTVWQGFTRFGKVWQRHASLLIFFIPRQFKKRKNPDTRGKSTNFVLLPRKIVANETLGISWRTWLEKFRRIIKKFDERTREKRAAQILASFLSPLSRWIPFTRPRSSRGLRRRERGGSA